jgi:YVTN family beta-propeller protein
VRQVIRHLQAIALAVPLLAMVHEAALGAGPDQLLYAVNQDDATVTVIDTKAEAVVTTFPVTNGPAMIAASPNGRRLYITHPAAAKLTVLDGASLDRPKVVDLKGTPSCVAVAPDGRVFVGDASRDVVSVLDGTPLAEIAEIKVGRVPAQLAISPSAGRIFVANRGADSVSVIDLESLSVIATVPVGHAPVALSMSPRGDRLYVANVASADLSVIGAETLATIATVNVGAMPYGLAVTPNAERVFVTNQQSATVSVMDVEGLVVTYRAKVGLSPEGIAVQPDGSRVYVANGASGDISVLSGETGHELKRIKLRSGTRMLAIVPAG